MSTAEGQGEVPRLEHMGWLEACGACHLAYGQGMLPARSWQRILAGLAGHFGTDASIDGELRETITAFLVANAADNPRATLGMQRIARSIVATNAPLRITSTPMFRYFHDEVSDSIWRREKIGTPANCPACHTRAAEGRYYDWEIRIPKE